MVIPLQHVNEEFGRNQPMNIHQRNRAFAETYLRIVALSFVLKLKGLFVCYAIVAMSTAVQNCPAASSNIDHLVPIPERLGSSAAYDKLWQQKLLVTPGDVARFVSLPGLVGEESAVSVYRTQDKKYGLPGGYWLTVTQASGRLWNCIPAPGVKRPIDPRTIKIVRCDLPLPESTALKIGDLWLAMLRHARPPPEESVVLDSSSELYFAESPAGKTLAAQAPDTIIPGGKTTALMDLANSLIEYCNVPETRRAKRIREIERAASALIKRVGVPTTRKRAK